MVRLAYPNLRALIRNFFNAFESANIRENLYGLAIAGMIDHTEGENKGHCSILYKLPGTIGVQSRERPAENLRLRAPVTLGSLLGTHLQGVRSALGALARKLVRAVCLLPSSSWLHKNIRADSVIFFPEHISSPQEDRYKVKIELDVLEVVMRRRMVALRATSIYSRNMVGKATVPEQTKEIIISGFTLIIISILRSTRIQCAYTATLTIYTLSVFFLLEIGL